MVQPPRNERGQFVSFKVRTEQNFGAVKTAAEKAAFRNLGHAAASISRDAKSTIEKSTEASQPGRPPHSRRGKLKRGIRFAYDKASAIIGPMFSAVGTSVEAHEFGRAYKGDKFPERPFMGPALQRAIPRFAQGWKSSVHS